MIPAVDTFGNPVMVDVILPCLNEAGAIPWIMERIPEGYRAIIVDNGSTDGSADIARDLGATVVFESRKGFGAACHAGLLAASAPIAMFSDCDASLDPGDFHLVVDPVAAGEEDFVMARRMPTERAAWSWESGVANKVLTQQIKKYTGYEVHDLGVLRAASREGLLGLGMEDRRSGYPLEMILRAKTAGWSLREVEAPYYPRIGKSKVTGTIPGLASAVWDMSALLRAEAKKLNLS
jgi:glycosyltransferase involved in cell wall biosynthesis